MPHRLSSRESRRLLRQFLRQEEEGEPRGGMLFASGPRRREPAAPTPPDRATGPYETEYAVLDGYATERTVIVP